MDDRLGLDILVAHFFVDSVQSCLLPVNIVLRVQPNIDFFGSHQLVHSIGNIKNEGAYEHLNAIDLVDSARHFLMHLNGRPLILVHLLNANVVTLLLLVELMTKSLELIRHSVHMTL